MQATKIDWCDYSWNAIKGWCQNTDCEIYDKCYAHRMMQRFKRDRQIRFDTKEYLQIFKKKLKPGSIIFVNSMIEMWHDSILESYKKQIINAIRQRPDLNFILLTKNFAGYIKSIQSFMPMPANLFIGVSITGNSQANRAMFQYKQMTSDFKYEDSYFYPDIISFEPLLYSCSAVPIKNIKWIIIGGLTPSPAHYQHWIDDIVSRCRNFNIPVFVKDNARYHTKIQEYPEAFKRSTTLTL